VKLENKTQTYYKKNHKALIERYNLASLLQLNKLFKKHIQKSYRVLDIGFGSGRDLRYIRTLGAEYWGVDGTQGFVEALKQDSYFKERLFCVKLLILDLKTDVKFDVDNAKMELRMLRYFSDILFEYQDYEVSQYVIYIGKDKCYMKDT